TGLLEHALRHRNPGHSRRHHAPAHPAVLSQRAHAEHRQESDDCAVWELGAQAGRRVDVEEAAKADGWELVDGVADAVGSGWCGGDGGYETLVYGG
ncbi:hypothetical protein V495_04545, partial [Pseudogymnoascus sp. VKM F-4514 (FW-929)]